jgi:moderate conductance mechanosensitive channel
MMPRLFTNSPGWQPLVLSISVVIVIAWLSASVVRRVVARVLRVVLHDTVLPKSRQISGPLRLIGAVTFILVFSVLIFPAFEVAGLHPRAGVHLRSLTAWAFDSGLRVLLIAGVAFALIRMVTIGVSRFENDVTFGTGLDAIERAKRARTLGSVITNIVSVVVVSIAVLMILQEFRVDISPALTGAGIVGVAIGFGSQNLVKDWIGGFFLILENQIRVGDVVAINGTGGLVESINLRTTVLRDEEGTVFIFPNGTITTLANRSKQYSFYVENLPLAYGVDTDRATAVMKDVADGLQKDDAYSPFILAPLEVLGVDAFEPNAVRVKVRIKTAPQRQSFVGREFRRRIYRAFGDQDIELWQAIKTLAVGHSGATTLNATTPNVQSPAGSPNPKSPS